jgi:hypothetical protein
MMLHIRYNGRSFDVDAIALGIDLRMTDAEIKARAARFLEVDAVRLDELVLDRAPSGALILRPEAVYG